MNDNTIYSGNNKVFRLVWVLVCILITAYLYFLYKPYLSIPESARHFDIFHNSLKPSGSIGHAMGIIGAVLIILPLILLRGTRPATGRVVTLLYFASIGLGYLLLEMTCLARLTHWIGDPVTTTAVTIAGFLFASGLGSLTAQRLRADESQTMFRVAVGILIVGAVALGLIDRLAASVGSLSPVLRCTASFVTIAPLAYLMGFLMPAGLARLDRSAPALIPWAWGVNGFASVLAAPLATAIGMSRGFVTVGLIALALYVAAGRLFAGLPAQR